MAPLISILQQYPELAIILTLTLGFFIGRPRGIHSSYREWDLRAFRVAGSTAAQRTVSEMGAS